MSKYGLAVIQAPAFDGERVSVETVITHNAGGWMRSTLHMRPTKSDPQGVGSAITYTIALCAPVGLRRGAGRRRREQRQSATARACQRFDSRPAEAPVRRRGARLFRRDRQGGRWQGLESWAATNAQRIADLTDRGRKRRARALRSRPARLQAVPRNRRPTQPRCSPDGRRRLPPHPKWRTSPGGAHPVRRSTARTSPT